MLPILIGIGVITGVTGIGKGIKAAVDNNDAKDFNRWANNNISEAKEKAEASRKASNTALEALGRQKLYVMDKSISKFIGSFEKIKNVQLEDSIGLNELNKFRLDKQSTDELRQMSDYASSILGGTMAGAMGGALAGFGAYGGAHLLATTGLLTGNAIFGAAATNATLAFLGGGSLAIGGLGMAGGAMVLGGLVAGPALAIMGFIVGAKASENLDNAKSNYAESKKIAEELGITAVLCNGIRRRSYMFERLLINLDAVLISLVCRLDEIVQSSINDNENRMRKKHWLLWELNKKKRAVWLEECKTVDYQRLSPDEKKIIAASASIATAIKTVWDTPILTEDGKLTQESEQIAGEIKSLIKTSHTLSLT